MPSSPRFPDLNDVLHQLADGVRAVLGPELIALYLTGSFALGDADEGSDVDFLAVTRGPLNENQWAAVEATHQTIFGLPSPWTQHLEGSYIPADLLRDHGPVGTPVPYLDNGSRTLELSDHDNTLVVRWVTREHGVPLFGPPASTLIGLVPSEPLKVEVRATLHEWGMQLLAGEQNLDNGWRQPYAALSIARTLHTLGTGAVYSKREAVEWSRQHAPEWTPLLARAWEQHPRQFLNYYQPADLEEVRQTRAFIGWAMTAFGEKVD
ncbi:nucleotidyltransferase domain-containing protein [Deinococcus sp. UYEF24]